MSKKSRERRGIAKYRQNRKLYDMYLDQNAKIGFMLNRDIPIIDASNVVRSWELDKKMKYLSTDFPCIAPPFSDFFVEFKTPVIHGGFAVTAFDAETYQAAYQKTHNELAYIRPEAKWVLCADLITELPNYRGVMNYGATALIFIDQDGRVIADNDNGQMLVDGIVMPGTLPDGYDFKRTFHVVASMIPGLLLTLSLINCRNIVLIDHEPDPETSREYERHFGQPLTKYKTLAIKQIGKRYDSSDPKPYQDLMPLHLRRGNFAHYTDDAPLFGKYTGTFWRPATVVGSEKNGVVVKDYKVEAPEEDTK